ncbi:MAG: glycosyl hydrolase family 18 protein [Bacteroidota bacterium]|nr:glycosyl hydrolase family 18 protein [Bacteroidota bacterium]
MRILFTIFFAVPLFLSAQEQFKSSNQRDWEFYQEHPEEIGKNIAQPSLAKRTDLMKTQSMNKVVYGFHPYWQNGSESNYYFSLLTHLVYFSADIDAATGGFSSTHSWSTASVVTQAQQYGVKVHLCLVLFENHSTLLTNTTAKNALIANTLAQLAVRNADGVNIDFEAVSSSVKTEFRLFMKQFGDSLKAHGYEFVIELPAVDWSNVFDATFFSTLDPITDFYFAMLYDYWWSGSSTAGPNSPLQSSSITNVWHVLRSINTYLNTKGCPANKFIAGFPNYGHDWTVSDNTRMSATTGGHSSRFYTNAKNNYLDTIPAGNKFFDATYNVPWYRYIAGGVWRQTWYDDSLSWAMKFDSIKVKNVGGTGMWALGYDGSEPEMWGALKTAFASTPNPVHTSIDDFENGIGHFDKYPRWSGSTTGIDITSSQSVFNDYANNGYQSMKVVLVDSSETSTDWSVRLVSGSGSRANNMQISNSGYIGFWMKTSSAPSGAQVALTIDDQRNGSSDKTELSSKQNVNNDGAWHLYEWNLNGSGWSSFFGGNGVLDSATLSLDAVMLYAPDGSPDWTLYLDDISRNSSGTLPVELENFSGFNTQLLIHLNWKTATEENNYGFEIERRAAENRSLEGNGSLAWGKIGFVAGSGTTNTPRSYTHVDAVTTSGTFTYRLRQIDRNGAFRYSSEMNVTIIGYPEAYLLEQNFPNPFNPTTTLQFAIPDGAARDIVTLKIYDLLGREVATPVNEQMDAGIYSIQWNATGLASGVYFYTLRAHQTNGGQAGNFVQTKKMTILK